MAGKNPPRPEHRRTSARSWRLNEPFYVAVREDDAKVATGVLPGKHCEYDILTSFETRQNVIHEIKKGIPATMSLCIGAAIIWLFFGSSSASSRRSLPGGSPIG